MAFLKWLWIGVVLALLGQLLVVAAAHADPDPTDSRREVIYLVYSMLRENKEPFTWGEIKFLKVYYWGVNGTTAVRLIPPPFPDRFITAPCAYGDYHTSLIDTQNRESTLKYQPPYFVNRTKAPGCS